MTTSKKSSSPFRLTLVLHRRTFTESSATDKASDAFDIPHIMMSGDAVRRAVPGIGDEAIRTDETDAFGGHMMNLAARRANVTIEVKYWEGPRPADEVAADTEALARAAVNHVRLD